MLQRKLVLFGCGVVALGLIACADQTSEGGAKAQSRGQEIFQSYCVTCHGQTGRGDGPISAELPVAPVDLTQLSAANDGVFPAERVMMQVYGYPGKFHKGLMPEFGPLLGGNMVEWTSETGETLLTPQPLLDLVAYLKTLQES